MKNIFNLALACFAFLALTLTIVQQLSNGFEQTYADGTSQVSNEQIANAYSDVLETDLNSSYIQVQVIR